jgi:hypothetical protein
MSGREFDQRKTYRCPVDPSYAMAELAVGRRRMPVRLYNASSGGFAALAEGDPGVSLGDVVGLRTSSGTFEVRVTHVGPVEAAAGAAQCPPSSYRLGLERLRDLASLDDLSSPARETLHRRRRFRFFPGTAVGTLAVVLLLVAVAMSGLTMWCSAQVPAELTSANAWSAPLPALPPTKPAAVTPDDEAGLTAAQQARVRDVAAAVAQMVRDCDAQWQGDPPAERLRKQNALRGAVQREMLRSLPEEQPARWQTPAPQP